jgi:hypothetical protein
MKLLVSGRVHDAQLHYVSGNWVVCIGKTVMVRPEHVTRLGVRIEEATDQERGTLRDAGYSFRA